MNESIKKVGIELLGQLKKKEKTFHHSAAMRREVAKKKV